MVLDILLLSILFDIILKFDYIIFVQLASNHQPEVLKIGNETISKAKKTSNFSNFIRSFHFPRYILATICHHAMQAHRTCSNGASVCNVNEAPPGELIHSWPGRSCSNGWFDLQNQMIFSFFLRVPKVNLILILKLFKFSPLFSRSRCLATSISSTFLFHIVRS